MAKPIRLVIVDDHPVVRTGLATWLADEPDIKVIGQTGSGAEAVALIRQLRPDIVLMDITLGDMTGLEATRQFASELPQVRTIILTIHEEETFFFEALQAGASGYVLKGVSSEELLYTIRTVFEGGVYLPPKLAAGLVQDYLSRQPVPGPLADHLTAREREVLILIAQGLTNRDITVRLNLSLNTVKTHRLRIYQKLNLQDRASLVNYALNLGLLQAPPSPPQTNYLNQREYNPGK